jgi:hypothetical protein
MNSNSRVTERSSCPLVVAGSSSAGAKNKNGEVSHGDSRLHNRRIPSDRDRTGGASGLAIDSQGREGNSGRRVPRSRVTPPTGGTREIKLAHLFSFLIGTRRAANLFDVRQHWVRSARECGYTFAIFQIGVRS